MRILSHSLARVAVSGLALAVGVVGAAATSRALTGRRAETPPASVVALQSSDVRSIAVESGARHVELTRSPDGRWTGVTGASPEVEGLMADIQARLFPLQGYRSVVADTSSPEYGLVQPEITLRVSGSDGGEHRVLLGAPTFTSGGVYARTDHDAARLYLVPRRMMDDLRSLLAGRRVDTPNDLPDKLREKTPKHDPTSWWLRQALDAEGGQ